MSLASEKLQGRYPEGNREVAELVLFLPSLVTILPCGKISLIGQWDREVCKEPTVYSKLEGGGGFPCGSVVKSRPACAGDSGLIPGWRGPGMPQSS